MEPALLDIVVQRIASQQRKRLIKGSAVPPDQVRNFLFDFFSCLGDILFDMCNHDVKIILMHTATLLSADYRIAYRHRNNLDDSCTIIINSFSLKKLYQMDDVYFKIEPLYTLKCPFYWTANMRYYSQKFKREG